MKLYIVFLLTIGWTAFASALRCWTCENAKSPRDCIRSGYSKQCRFTEKVCQTEVRYSVGWGSAPIIRTGCKEPHACGNNQIQNPRRAWLPSQCNGEKFNSVCRCCCDSHHCNRKNLLCQPEIGRLLDSTPTPSDDAKTPIPTPSEPVCKRFPKKPVNGKLLCADGKYVGSKCYFACNVGYRLVGSSIVTCVQVGKSEWWNRRTPICVKKIECKNLPNAPKDGRVECHGSGELDTECNFACDDGLRIMGATVTKCIKGGEEAIWSNEIPTCLSPVPSCPDIGELRHGNITCTSKDNGVGTKCSFQCSDEGYSLLPSERLDAECVQEGQITRWSHRKPCCNAMCPPVAKKDIVIVIDSSRSINMREWNTMKDFVTSVIGKFQVSQEAAQFAVYRFNGRVDEQSQILFGDYDDVTELVEKVKNLPKKGGGTKVGNALRHARDFVLKQNNREHVDDMVWVLTDGKSKDSFEAVAKDLRDNGVEIIALGISRKGEEEFMQQLTAMTGDKDLVIEVTDVLSSFSDDLVQLLSSKICEVSCES